MIKILIIALVIYLLVVTRARIRLPHPGLQATVDVLKAADLSDDEVQRMAAQYVRYCDAQNRVAPAGDPYAERLARLTGRYVAVNGIPLNFKVYKTTAVNAFATADGSIRVFSGLMDRLGDDELMAIVGHEMGHVRNHDTIGAMRKAYLASAARSALGAVGGERLHVQFSTADGAVEIAVVGDGKGRPREEVESEIARYVLRSLADEVEIEENGAGQIGSIRMKKRLSGGA